MVVVGGGGLQHFSVSPRPLGFGFWGFGAKGLGPGIDNSNRLFNNVSLLPRTNFLKIWNAVLGVPSWLFISSHV